jgi:hypothetical protein
LGATWLLAKQVWAGQQQNQARPTGSWLWQLAVNASLIAWYIHGIFDFVYGVISTYVAFALIAGLAVRATKPFER